MTETDRQTDGQTDAFVVLAIVDEAALARLSQLAGTFLARNSPRSTNRGAAQPATADDPGELAVTPVGAHLRVARTSLFLYTAHQPAASTYHRHECASRERKLQQFRTHGSLLRTIQLQPDIESPRRAIQLSSGQFVISHRHWRRQGGPRGPSPPPNRRAKKFF